MPMDITTYDLPVYDGDFAIRCPLLRQYWTIEMAEQWAKIADYFYEKGAGYANAQ